MHKILAIKMIRNIKISKIILTSTLLLILILSFTSTSNALPMDEVFKCTPVIKISYDFNETLEPIPL